MSSRTLSGGGAGRLGFIAHAMEAFAFLLRIGFSVVRREATLLRFESSNVFVNVYHGRASYQVGLELGRLNEGDTYSLHEVLSAIAPAEIERARCQATDRATLERCLTAMADTIQRSCHDLLRGDAAAFEELQSVVAPKRQVETIRSQFGAIIDRADRAWESKDFTQAADLYEKAAPGLDATRVKRLEYLRGKGPKRSDT